MRYNAIGICIDKRERERENWEGLCNSAMYLETCPTTLENLKSIAMLDMHLFIYFPLMQENCLQLTSW